MPRFSSRLSPRDDGGGLEFMSELRRRLRSCSVGPMHARWPLTRSGTELLASEWRRSVGEGDARPDLRGVDFRGLVLDGIDLSECRLRGSSFEGAALRGANLTRSDLRGVSFRRCALSGANLHAVDASEAVFDDALLDAAIATAANFTRTSLRHASLERADVSSTTFFAADLRNSRFAGSTRSGTDFEEADTTWAESGANAPRHTFAPLERSYMSLLNLRVGCERALRGIEACVLHATDVNADARTVLETRNWRVQLIGATAMAFFTPTEETMRLAWQFVERDSWVSPQLVCALSLSGFTFPRSDLHSAKARGAVKACTGRPSADDAENEGHEVAKRWLERLESLTVLLGR